MPGIVSSSVGYTGGKAANPTYKSVCSGDGHTEAVRLVFDPKVISYEELMKKVIHQASPYPSKPQYMSAVWTQNEQQAEIAKRLAEEKRKPKLPILALDETKWFDAEDYHQKYVAKARGEVFCSR